MRLIAFLAFRNVTRTRRRSLVIALAVAGGGAAMVFLLAMNTGLSRATLENAVALGLGHLQVEGGADPATLDGLSNVEGVAPRVELPALAGRPGRARAVMLVGIDPAREGSVTRIPRSVAEGTLPAGGVDAALGRGLARRIGASVGSTVPVAFKDARGHVRQSQILVTGIVETGREDVDDRTAWVAIDTARRALGEGAPEKIVVRLRRPDRLEPSRAEIASRVRGPVRTWQEVSPSLAGFIAYQRGSVNVVLLVIYLVVGGGVAAVQLMGILERTREIGVLASIGFVPRRVVALIALESALVGTVAAAVGVAAGWALVVLAASRGIDVRLLAGGESLEGLLGLDPYLRPVMTRAAAFLALGLVVPVVLLGGVLPALRAARLTPMEALRQ